MSMIDPYAQASGTISVEAEIAGTVQARILPNLRAMLAELATLQEVWNTPGNDIPAKIAAAAQSGGTVAGYSPDTWIAWGETLIALMTFLQTPLIYTNAAGQEITTTPKAALLTRYNIQPVGGSQF